MNQPRKLYLFADNPGPRLDYACEILLRRVLDINVTILHNITDFQEVKHPKCHYASLDIPGSLGIRPHGLLAETGIRPVSIPYAVRDDTPLPFAVQPSGPLPEFDPFAAAFYWASRYEEYLPHPADRYGRFPTAASESHRLGALGQALIHRWGHLLDRALAEFFPEQWTPRNPAPMRSLFTFDIDIAYAFRGRAWHTRLLSTARDISRADIRRLKQKRRYFSGKTEDPFDTYDWILQTEVDKQFFFLLAERRSRFDRNISPERPELQTLIRRLDGVAGTGIHPSYYTPEQPAKLRAEMRRMAAITGRPVTSSRQHYLRLRLPDTYRNLMANGIRADYSMQFADAPGFRAGLCVPYPFYDLQAERTTDLLLYPGCVMDSCFRDDLHLTAAESLSVYQSLRDEVARHGGWFIPIWHNDLLAKRDSDDDPLNFRKVYEALLNTAGV